MSVYVVGLNRLFWRRLYRLAETRYSLQQPIGDAAMTRPRPSPPPARRVPPSSRSSNVSKTFPGTAPDAQLTVLDRIVT